MGMQTISDHSPCNGGPTGNGVTCSRADQRAAAVMKPTTTPIRLALKVCPLPPTLSPTYDPCTIKTLHSSPPIKSIIVAGIRA